MQPDTLNPVPAGAQQDHEGAMARADLYKLANYSLKLFKKLDDSAQLEGWVQAKITKAADYVASVYHYMEYEMKFNEYGEHLANAEVMSEGQKAQIINKLTEARQKVAALKKIQADKMSGKKVDEGVLSGGERPCAECGGSGMVYEEPKAVPDHVKGKVDKYKRLTKAMHAASKRLDRNNNGIPDHLENDQEVGEDQGDLKKVGDTTKTSKGGTVTKTSTGIKHERDPSSYDDGGDADEKSGKGTKSHAKAQSAAEKKERAPAQKQSKTGTWGMKDGAKFDNRKKEKAVDETFGQGVYAEGKGKKPDFLDMDKDGDKKEPMKKAVADKKAGPKKGVNPFAKKTNEALKGGQHKLDVDDDGDIEGDDLADLRAGKKKKEKKVDESGKKTMSQAAKGNEKYGKDGMKALAKAGRNGASEKKLDAIRDKHDNYSESWKLKAKALKENLDAMTPDQDMELSLDEAGQIDLTALLQQIQQTDPKGLEQAIAAEQTTPGSIAKFMDSKMKGGAKPGQSPTPDASATPANPTPNPTMGQAPTAQQDTAMDDPANQINESSELDRMKQFLTRLNG